MRSKSSFGIATLVTAAALVAATDVTLAQRAQGRTVAGWRVADRVNKDGQQTCTAHIRTDAGILRLTQNHRGNWIAAFALPRGEAQQVTVRLGQLQSSKVRLAEKGGRGTLRLDPGWLDAFARGGTFEVMSGSGRAAWQLGGLGAVIAAIDECAGKNRSQPPAIAASPRQGSPPPPAVTAPPPASPPPVAMAPRQQPAAAAPHTPPARSAPSAGAATDPVEVLKLIYNPSAATPPDEPFSARLMALYQAAIARSNQLQEPVSGLDFAYSIDGQDAEEGTAASVRYHIVDQTPRQAQVNVTFTNGGPRELRYDFVNENGRWLIDEVRRIKGGDDANWVLSELFREGAATKR